MDTGQMGVDKPEPRAPDPAGLSDPFDWVKAARRAGFKVDQHLRGVLTRLMDINGWDVADSFAWLEAEGLLSRVDHSFRLAPETSARVDWHEGETRLPPARYEVGGDTAVIHFPEAGDLRPLYGFVFAQQGDGTRQEVGAAQGQLTIPMDGRLALWGFHASQYGRAFRGLPPDLFDTIVPTLTGWKTNDDDLAVISDLYQARRVSIGYTNEIGLTSANDGPHRVTDHGLAHLARFDRLEAFGLMSKQVTDDGLAVLADKRLEPREDRPGRHQPSRTGTRTTQPTREPQGTRRLVPYGKRNPAKTDTRATPRGSCRVRFVRKPR